MLSEPEWFRKFGIMKYATAGVAVADYDGMVGAMSISRRCESASLQELLRRFI